MKSYVRWIILAAGVGVAVGLFFLLRPGSSPDDRSAPASSATTASSTLTPTPEGTLMEVTVRGGTVDGPSEPQVRQGQEVRIVVDADVADEIHVHGYDLKADVEPGRPAELSFEATATGVFEVELEEAGLLLFQLKVVP